MHPTCASYQGDTLRIFTEYMCGGSIKQMLDQFGPFEETTTVTYTQQIVSGLCYLHSRGIVHRDLKGQNCLVGEAGEVRLADFGTAATQVRVNESGAIGMVGGEMGGFGGAGPGGALCRLSLKAYLSTRISFPSVSSSLPGRSR